MIINQFKHIYDDNLNDVFPHLANIMDIIRKLAQKGKSKIDIIKIRGKIQIF